MIARDGDVLPADRDPEDRRDRVEVEDDDRGKRERPRASPAIAPTATTAPSPESPRVPADDRREDAPGPPRHAPARSGRREHGEVSAHPDRDPPGLALVEPRTRTRPRTRAAPRAGDRLAGSEPAPRRAGVAQRRTDPVERGTRDHRTVAPERHRDSRGEQRGVPVHPGGALGAETGEVRVAGPRDELGLQDATAPTAASRPIAASSRSIACSTRCRRAASRADAAASARRCLRRVDRLERIEHLVDARRRRSRACRPASRPRCARRIRSASAPASSDRAPAPAGLVGVVVAEPARSGSSARRPP